jgi:hypothetical protein
MTTHLNKGCNASNHPYGSAKEPEVREYIIQTDDIVDEKSMSQLIFLVKEQRKRISYLEAELEFFKEKVSKQEDWRYIGE